MAAEIVSSCRIGISPEMKKDIATCTSPGVKQRKDWRRIWESARANVLLELAAWDDDAKLPLINTRLRDFVCKVLS